MSCTRRRSSKGRRDRKPTSGVADSSRDSRSADGPDGAEKHAGTPVTDYGPRVSIHGLAKKQIPWGETVQDDGDSTGKVH